MKKIYLIILFLLVLFCEKVNAQNCSLSSMPSICYVTSTPNQTIAVNTTWNEMFELHNAGSSCSSSNSWCSVPSIYLSINHITLNGTTVTPSTYIGSSFTSSSLSLGTSYPSSYGNIYLSASFNTAGTYVIYYDMHYAGSILSCLSLGCLYSTVTVTSSCTPVSISSSPSNQPIFSGNTATFNVSASGTPPFSYFWYTNGSFTTSTPNSFSNTNSYTTPILYTNNSGNTYYCIITNCNNNNQAISSTASVTVNSSCTTPSNPPNPTSSSQCGSVIFTRSGTVPSNEIWYWQGSSCGTSTNLGSGSIYTASSSGTYYIRAYNTSGGGCWSNSCGNAYGTINSSPSFTYSIINASCIGCSNGSITVYTSGGSSPYQYSKNGGSFQSPNVFSGLSAGTYSIQVKDANSCTSTTQFVTILQPPVVTSISPTVHNIDACTNITFSATVSNSPTSYVWTFQGGTPYTVLTANGSNPTIVFNNPGSYSVSLVASNSAGSSTLFSSGNNYITVRPTVCAQAPPPYNYVIQKSYPSKQAAEPVDIATGSYQYTHADFRLPAVNTSLDFTRYYSTVNASINSALGYGWSHSYDFSVTNQADTEWSVHYGDGHSSVFIPLYSGNGTSFALYGGTYETLYKDPVSSLYTLTFKTGEVYLFNSNSKLASIVDLDGNTTMLNYSGNNLASIVAPGGRTLTLSYNGSLISAVTDPIGRTDSFSYDVGGNLYHVKDANYGTTIFYYNSLHLVTKILTPMQDTLISNTYDAQNRVIVQKDALNQPTYFSYTSTSSGVTATITYPDTHTATAYHDTFYRLVQETDQLGHSKYYAYDYNNNLASLTNENGDHTAYSYDAFGNKLAALMPLNTNMHFAYNSINRPTIMTNPAGDTTSINYDAYGNAYSMHFPDGSSKNYTYYSNGLLHTYSDGLSHLTTYNYNSAGDLSSVVSPSGTKIFTYDLAGRRLSQKDEDSHTTNYTYNNNDMLTGVLYPMNVSQRDSFDLDNNLIRHTDKNGYKTYFYYDVKDRLSSIHDARGGISSFAYDSTDNLITVTDPDNHSVSYAYDAKNSMVSKVSSLGTIHYGYDNLGNRTSEMDVYGNTKYFFYDSLSRKTAAEDALTNSSGFAYNALGQINSITDPLTRVTAYTYNKVGSMTGITDAASHPSAASYDYNGNRLSITDANNHTQYFTYDSSNRMNTYKDAANNLDSFYYDGVGNLTRHKTPTGTIIKTYDSLNRVIYVANSTGNNYSYTYDSTGNLKSMTNNYGTSYFTYDSLNHLKQYTDMFGKTVQYTYDSAGNKKSITYPGNHTVNYYYNNDNMLVKVTDWLNHSTNYIYDSSGRLKATCYPNGDTCLYTYDIAGRLISKTNKIASAVFSQSIFSLDANGNRVQEQRQGPVPFHLTAASNAYSYGADDRLNSDSVTSYTNDAAGNRTAAGSTAYTFSVDNLFTASGTSTYKYDARGNRIEKNQGGLDRRYVLDLSGSLSQVLMETDSTGAIKVYYVYGLGLIERIDSTGNNSLYYHFDAQHNTIALSNSNAQITDTFTYDPFGKLLKHGGQTQQPFTFLGEYGVQQETSTIYYVRARYYDAANGRFLGKDPFPTSLMDPQTLNRYSYCLNNPLNRYDASGNNWLGDAFNAYSNWADKFDAGAAKVGIALWQIAAGVGDVSLAYFEVQDGPVGIALAGQSLNEAFKNVYVAFENIGNAGNANYEWKGSDDIHTKLDYFYEDPIVNRVLTLVGIGDIGDIVEEGQNILSASNSLGFASGFANQAIVTSSLKIIQTLLGIYSDVQTSNNSYQPVVNQNKKCGN